MSTLRTLKRSAVDYLRGETNETFFDVRKDSPSLRSLLNQFGLQESSTPGDSNKPYRVYELRADLRDTFPLGWTPAGRRDFLAWFLAHGIAEFDLNLAEVLAAFREQDATPDRGLAVSYRLQPSWQMAVPDALTSRGWPLLRALIRTRYDLDCRWLNRSRPPLTAAKGKGVNVLAHFRYASGLQEAATGIVEGFRRAGRPVARRDLPVLFPCDWSDRERYMDLEDHDVSIYVAALNTFPDEWYPRAGLFPRPGVKRIAVWYWELEQVPAEWHARMQWPDEVWAPTTFIADAVRPIVSCPVVPMLPGVSLPAYTPLPRSRFGLPDDRFLFLFNFDMGSVMARKNPLAIIEAYRLAFRPDDRVHLAIKVSRGNSRPDDFRRLKAAAEKANVTIIDRVLPRGELLALLNAADAYVSLHRSEGLGLGMAECMLMGTPVVATGYSGNLDFMTADTAKLVPYRLVPIETEATPNNPYPQGSLWAEPDVDVASVFMRDLAMRPELARELGLQGQAYAREKLSPEGYSKRLLSRVSI